MQGSIWEADEPEKWIRMQSKFFLSRNCAKRKRVERRANAKAGGKGKAEPAVAVRRGRKHSFVHTTTPSARAVAKDFPPFAQHVGTKIPLVSQPMYIMHYDECSSNLDRTK